MSRYYNKHEEKYVLYEKRGRRYYPVSEYDPKVTDAFPAGFTLVHVKPGCTSYRFNVSPAVPEVLAAARLLEDAMLKAMHEAAKYKPDPIPVTEEEQAAWKHLEAILEKNEGVNRRMLRLWGCSANDMIAAGIKVLEDYVKEQMEKPDAPRHDTGA